MERVIERCQTNASLKEKLPAALQLLPRQRWLESRTDEALACSMRAHECALELGDTETAERINVSIASWLVLLGRYNEAQNYVPPETKADIISSDPAWVRADKFAQQAIILATQGNAPAAFTEFERAIDAAKELPDGYLATVIWDDYANWATALGRLDIARACRERALLVARERRVAWRIPYLTLRFADMLVTAGDYKHALDLLRDVLTYDTDTPVIRILLSIVGVETAVALQDTALLDRMMNDEALELAFTSCEPGRIAQIVAAYTKVYIARNDSRRAARLIARGIAITQQADHAWELLALAAKCGSPTDATRAHTLLEERMKMPHHAVAQAYGALWQTYDAQRRRARKETEEYAKQAARLFSRLKWRRQQEEALVLSGNSESAPSREADGERTSILSELSPALTKREQQIAELVIRGLTNRAISQSLSISEHTVERHMTSILNRLGLRSRWQLLDISHH
jgi:ATP/maltotriose-dependent transcriptional regulator MalT